MRDIRMLHIELTCLSEMMTPLIGLMILPVVGSLLSMPLGPSVEILRGLKKKYGDIASFAIFGTR